MQPKIVDLTLFLLLLTMLTITIAQQPKKKSWRDKDIRDMTEVDLEHLLEQWEVGAFDFHTFLPLDCLISN